MQSWFSLLPPTATKLLPKEEFSLGQKFSFQPSLVSKPRATRHALSLYPISTGIWFFYKLRSKARQPIQRDVTSGHFTCRHAAPGAHTVHGPRTAPHAVNCAGRAGQLRINPTASSTLSPGTAMPDRISAAEEKKASETSSRFWSSGISMKPQISHVFESD